MVAEAILRIGIIGVGNIGSAHMKALLAGEIPKACLTAVCDVDPQKLEQCKERTPALPCFTDHRKLLDSGLCDAVIIATPHYFHPPIAIDAFAAGLHVLTEKPAGVDRLSVEKMNEAAKSSDRKSVV